MTSLWRYFSITSEMESQSIAFNFLSWILSKMWIYIAIVVIVCVLYALKDWIRILKFISTLNGPSTVPIFGNVDILLQGNLLQKMSSEGTNYGRIFRIWIMCVPYVVLLEPEDIQLILQSNKHVQKIGFYKMFDSILGKGLITQNVDKWKIHRRVLQPAFHYQTLKQFVGNFNECAEHVFVARFLEKDGKDVNITSFVNETVYNMLVEAILGLSTKEGCITPFKYGQFKALERFAQPWLLVDWIYRLTKASKWEAQYKKNLFDFCLMKVKQKRDYTRNGSSGSNDEKAITKMSMLEYMIELSDTNPSFTEQDIIEECCTFMLAGQDSVNTATAMTIFLLANNPVWQEKCIVELDEIFGDDERSATMEDLQKMKCLEMCIKESLRLYPSVPLFARTLGEDVKIRDKVIPAGCGVFMFPFSTHRLNHHYSDPEDFKPERFNFENSKTRHPFAFIPFSAGPRNCIGYKFAMLEIKSMISAVLRKCRLEPVIGKNKPIFRFRITIKAIGGLWVKVKSRHRHVELH